MIHDVVWTHISKKKKKSPFRWTEVHWAPTSTTSLAPCGILLLSFSCRLLKPQAAGAVFRPVVFILYSLGFDSLSCLPGVRSVALRIPAVGEIRRWPWEEAVWLPLWKAFTSSSTSEGTGVHVKCTALSLRVCVLPYQGRGGGGVGGEETGCPGFPHTLPGSPISSPVLQWPHA